MMPNKQHDYGTMTLKETIDKLTALRDGGSQSRDDEPLFIWDTDECETLCVIDFEVGEHQQIIIHVKSQQQIYDDRKAAWYRVLRSILGPTGQKEYAHEVEAFNRAFADDKTTNEAAWDITEGKYGTRPTSNTD